MRAVGHRRESLGVSGCKSGDSGSEAGKEISANCRRTTRVADKIKEIEQVVIMSKHCGRCAVSQVYLLRPCERLVLQSSANGFMHVVSALLSGYSIGEMASRWKNPLPAPFSPSVRILTFEGVRQGDPTQPACPIALVLLLYALKMLGKWFFDRRRQHRVAIFISLTRANHDFVARKIDILDPQLQTFHQSQAGAVEQDRHQRCRTLVRSLPSTGSRTSKPRFARHELVLARR